MLVGKGVRLIQMLVAAAVLGRAPAWAWGASGHRMISEIAAQSFPEEIPTFLRTPGAAQTIGELRRELDRSKAPATRTMPSETQATTSTCRTTAM